MGFFSLASWNKDVRPKSSIPRCGECGLAKSCTSPRMPLTGKGRHKILFIGEAPGAEEDRQGTQLIGKAGQCLRKMLGSLGIDLDDCWKTNAVACRPPHNQIEPRYIEACRPALLKAIRDTSPAVVVLLGESAVESLLPTEWAGEIGTIGKWVGWTIPSPQHKAYLCPTYHPSYVLRTGEDLPLVEIVKSHLQAAIKLETAPQPKDVLSDWRRQVECITRPRDMRIRLKALAETEGILGFDYETTGLKPEADEQKIWTAGFSLNGEQTFAGRVDESCFPALSRVLLNPKLRKIASNLKFEERWTRRKLGHGVRGWDFDTMLGSHILNNRGGVCSLKFQAYVTFGIGDYSGSMKPFLESDTANGRNRIHEAPLLDLLMYNGLDALIECKLAERQKALLR